jgi:AraC-like DNA-binding protein
MKFATSDGYQSVSRSYEVPSHYSQFQISGALPLYIKGEFGDYLTQIIRANGCHIQFNIFSMLEDKLLYPYTSYSVIPLHFMLQGDIQCWLEGFGEAWLIEKSINLFYVPGSKYHKAWFKPGLYKSFHIDFSPRTLRRLAIRYPELEDILVRISVHSGQGTRQHISYITPAVQKIVDEILYSCPSREPDLSTFVEIKGKELLLKYLQSTSIDSIHEPKTRKEFIDGVADFIKKHPDYPLTIRLLAKRFGTNETTLKKQFKQFTGKTIYRYLIDQRMKEAVELLNSGEIAIGDIAMRVGYEDFSSFDRAFSNYWGHPPAFYRKNK